MSTELIGNEALEELCARADAVAKRWKACIDNNTNDASEIIEECISGGASFLAAVAMSEELDQDYSCILLNCCLSNRISTK